MSVVKEKLWFFLNKTTKDYNKGGRESRNQKQQEKNKKHSEDNIVTDLRNFFQVLKRQEAIKDKIIRDIRTCFEEEECYCKPVRLRNFCSNIYIEYGSNNGKVKHYKSKKTLKKLNHV